jgi:hypothetical protein
MRALLWLTALVLPGLIYAQTGELTRDDYKMRNEAISPNSVPITITINPEARVSVLLTGPMPAPVSCGSATEFSIRILNHGFVTSRVEAAFVGDVPEGVRLEFKPAPLKGVREEVRHLRIILTKPGSTDLTIAFKIHNETPDLGGRDRIHFLVGCLQVE